MFKRTLYQYDLLRKRGAYIEQYKKEDMFRNDLSEFDDSRCVSSSPCAFFFGPQLTLHRSVAHLGMSSRSFSKSIAHARRQTMSTTGPQQPKAFESRPLEAEVCLLALCLSLLVPSFSVVCFLSPCPLPSVSVSPCSVVS